MSVSACALGGVVQLDDPPFKVVKFQRPYLGRRPVQVIREIGG